MTPKELMRVIVQTEHEARTVYDDALRRQEAFQADLAAEKEKLRQEIFAQAQKDVDRAQAAAVERADAEIGRLDTRLEYEMHRAQTLFESNESALTDKLFRIVVGLDG